ncbi:MAG: 2'-5' RNA ligase family protein [Alphaproteobacteria bacterium]|nr:2'-5' RNA ligase family protein [Alphaproteobacteria bacterium]
MKSKLYFFVNFLSIFIVSEVFAAKGLVIKLEVTNTAQNIINKNIRVPSGMNAKQTSHHVTIGYIDANIPDKQMDQLGKQLTQELRREYPKAIRFNVAGASLPFRNKNNVIALIPDNKNKSFLKKVNKKTNDIVKKHHHKLNNLTQPNNYTPHMTISTKQNDLRFLQRLNSSISLVKKRNINNELFFNLYFSYTVMK